MTTNVLIAFYSTYGHVHRMALAVATFIGGAAAWPFAARAAVRTALTPDRDTSRANPRIRRPP